VIEGATHYYRDQPQALQQAVDACLGWMRERMLFD
jgi:hypothetical protein